MGVNCCYRCVKRTITCHSTCEEYLAQAEQNRRNREARAEIREREDLIIGYINSHRKGKH